MIGPVMDQLATGSGTGFLCACLAAPWLGRSVYQGHLFQNGRMQCDLKRDLFPHIDGAIGIVAYPIIAAGAQAIRLELTAMKERGIRLALLDAVDEDQCSVIAQAVARQPILAGPAWLCPAWLCPARLCPAGLEPQSEPQSEPYSEPHSLGEAASPALGPLAMLSGALDRQTLVQTAAARLSMPVMDLDSSNPNPAEQVAQALEFARPFFGKTPFLITSSAPPDKIRADFPATEMLAAIARALHGAGIRNFLLNGNDTAAAILREFGLTRLTAGAAFAGLRWLHGQDSRFLIKPGGFGAKNLFLYDFEPQTRLNEPAE